jgi:hypothetical protein
MGLRSTKSTRPGRSPCALLSIAVRILNRRFCRKTDWPDRVGEVNLDSMQIHCPQCGSIIHVEDAESAPQVVKCWMCHSVIEDVPSNPGPATVRVPSSLPRERPSPIGLMDSPFPETANPKLSAGERRKICVVTGPSQGNEFEITRLITMIGRMGGGADIEIDDPEVSRSHCAIEVRRDGILLYDLSSTNGTFLGNTRVSVVRLEPMSIFRIGTSQLQLKAT